jgi:hypothetical protein
MKKIALFARISSRAVTSPALADLKCGDSRRSAPRCRSTNKLSAHAPFRPAPAVVVQFGAIALSASPLSSRPRRASIISATRKASVGDHARFPVRRC